MSENNETQHIRAILRQQHTAETISNYYTYIEWLERKVIQQEETIKKNNEKFLDLLKESNFLQLENSDLKKKIEFYTTKFFEPGINFTK
jgi:regulator of replication initiation timing